MRLVACLLLVAIASAWDPVRPGALVRRIGDMIIINQSVRLLLNFENVTHIKDALVNIQEGINVGKDRLNKNDTPSTRLQRKLATLEDKLSNLEANFFQDSRKREV